MGLAPQLGAQYQYIKILKFLGSRFSSRHNLNRFFFLNQKIIQKHKKY
jgi:hypothetical protein